MKTVCEDKKKIKRKRIHKENKTGQRKKTREESKEEGKTR